MMRRAFFMAVILLFSNNICFSAAGKTGWTVFRKAKSAKFKSITVTPVMAVRGDLAGVFYNPAVLSLNRYKEMFVMSELGMSDDVFGGVVYGHPTKKGCFAGGIVYYNAGKMDLNWLENGTLKTQNVTAQKDLLAMFSYGFIHRDNLALGGTFKMATSSLFERASSVAIAVDAGCLYMPAKLKNVTVTASIQNLGTSSKFVEKSNPLPMSAFVGAGYLKNMKNDYFLAPGVDITYLFSEKRAVPELGVEFGRDALSVNFGYMFSDEASWHIGLTFLKPKFDVAYAFLPGVHLNSTHRISFGYRLGNLKD